MHLLLVWDTDYIAIALNGRFDDVVLWVVGGKMVCLTTPDGFGGHVLMFDENVVFNEFQGTVYMKEGDGVKVI